MEGRVIVDNKGIDVFPTELIEFIEFIELTEDGRELIELT